MSTRIGFIGQGWIGKHYADDFERRGYAVTRYALEEPYVANREAVGACDIVFIAVPTPTTPEGFDDSYVRDALKNVGDGMTAVIKSTIVPGTTEMLQTAFPEIVVVHSPEFLVEKTAAHDAANPTRNIVGIPTDTDTHRRAAEAVHAVLPSAPYAATVSAREAELIKYAANCFLYTKVIYMNLLYDLVQATGGEWEAVRAAVAADPRIGESHTNPVHQSGRGAGGHCFIKDFEAFRGLYHEALDDPAGAALLTALAEKNLELLRESGKDLELIRGVYGEAAVADMSTRGPQEAGRA